MVDVPHVVLDCTAIPMHRGGVGRYIEGLLRGFDPSRVALTLVVQHRDRDALGALAPWADVHALSPMCTRRPLRLLWEQVGLPRLARRAGADLIHSPHYTFPVAWRGGRVVTIHDATFFSDPRTHRPLKRAFFRLWTRLTWRFADAVITPSAATAGEVERFIGTPRAYIEVAFHGANSQRFHPPTAQQLGDFRSRLALNSSDQWFAFLGTIEPRKNVVALLDAYAALRREFGNATPQLFLSGRRGWDKDAIARLDSLGDRSGVRELGYLPVEMLPALLGGAVAVVYPSIAEGFGLPVLEAMACGAPVITTNRLAIPEVGGNAVLYVEPDADSIQQALRLLLGDESERERLGALARERAALFTWQATALDHVSAYRHAIGSL